MTIPDTNQLNEGDILRIDHHNTIHDADRSLHLVVDSIDEQGEETTISLVDEWNDAVGFELNVSDSGAHLSGNVWREGSVDSIKVVGQVSPEFGKYYVLFRPQPYRDHILRRSDGGKYQNVCSYNVDIHDGERIREDKITSRQRSLINICDGCRSDFNDHLREKLPERMKRSRIDEDTPFLCPKCGEPPEWFEHVDMLGGMISHHEDGQQCGPWSGQAYLEWRLDGSNRQ